MRTANVGALLLSFVLLVSCVRQNSTRVGVSSSSRSTFSSLQSSVVSSSKPRETVNVSYTGVVQPSGISMYMEGTHRLVLPDRRFILLTAEGGVDFNAYLGQEVTAYGAIRPTVEGNGMIMRVDRLQARSSSAVSLAGTSSLDASSSLAPSVGSLVSAIPQTRTSTPPSSSEPPSSSNAPVTQSSSHAATAFDERIAAMTKEDLSASRWTRSYCSTHIGFCFTYHKNWWHKSFGTTGNTLWHVELSSAEIDMLGEGPIVVQLLSGDLLGVSDGQIATQGSMVTGYRAWTEGRHFEARAPVGLKAAVEMIIKSIAASAN